MVYLHEAPYNETLVRHWVNEIADSSIEGYEIATYKIRQVETDIIYGEAVDVIPCRYTYEPTEELIEEEEDNPEGDD